MAIQVFRLTNLGICGFPTVYRTLHVALDQARRMRAAVPACPVWIGAYGSEDARIYGRSVV